MLSVGLIKVGLFDLQRDARERSKYHIVQMEININATEFRIFINCFFILYLIDAFGGCFCTSSSYFRLQPSISLWIYVSKNYRFFYFALGSNEIGDVSFFLTFENDRYFPKFGEQCHIWSKFNCQATWRMGSMVLVS